MNSTQPSYEVTFWFLFSMGLLLIALSGCTVPKGDIEFSPVVTEELYDLEPYEE